MMFDKFCINKILNKEKTVTRRLIGKKRPAKPGTTHKLKIDRTPQTFGKIKILSCTQEQIRDITEEETKKEGFKNRKQYIDYFMNINNIDILNEFDWIWRVEFKLL